jgi:hypothetical protein
LKEKKNLSQHPQKPQKPIECNSLVFFQHEIKRDEKKEFNLKDLCEK